MNTPSVAPIDPASATRGHGSPPPRSHATRKWVALVALAWLSAGVVASVTGAFVRAPFLAPVSVLVGSAALLLGARAWAPLADVSARLSTRAILLGHALRAPIGALFLVEHALGHLPATFAIRAGWGDLAAGLGALALALTAPSSQRGASRRLVIAWGLFGLGDILLVVGTAGYLAVGLRDPLLLSAFDRFPYGLLPTVVVPLVISSHVALLAGARRVT